VRTIDPDRSRGGARSLYSYRRTQNKGRGSARKRDNPRPPREKILGTVSLACSSERALGSEKWLRGKGRRGQDRVVRVHHFAQRGVARTLCDAERMKKKRGGARKGKKNLTRSAQRSEERSQDKSTHRASSTYSLSFRIWGGGGRRGRRRGG